MLPTIPPALPDIEHDTQALGFSMPSERETGSLLRTLAAMKPAGRLLELGTGTGLATAWLLSGMGRRARLDSVDNDPEVLAVARRHLGSDARVTFHACPGEQFIARAAPASYDLIFADAWPGKYSDLEATLALLTIGGIYVVDDMHRQPNWPEGHERRASELLALLQGRPDLAACHLTWATGVVVCARTA